MDTVSTLPRSALPFEYIFEVIEVLKKTSAPKLAIYTLLKAI